MHFGAFFIFRLTQKASRDKTAALGIALAELLDNS